MSRPDYITCPTCGNTVEWSSTQRWRPFCSERCKLIDLGSWLDGSNRIPGEEPAPVPDTAERQEPPD